MGKGRKETGAEMQTDNVALFPMWKTMAWRPVEATCLRAAGAGNVAVQSVLMHLRLKYTGAPADLVEAELERVQTYMQAKIRQYKRNAGLMPFEQREDAADVVEFEPPPAA